VRLAIIVAAVVLAVGNARADLYTDYVSSVEWLVASADEIYLVDVVEHTDNGKQLTVKIKDVLRTRDLVENVAASGDWPLYRWRTEGAAKNSVIALSAREFAGRRNWAYHSRVGDEYLVFVRQAYDAEDPPLYIFRAVDLTRPQFAYWTSAITGDGTVLTKRETIIKAVDKRLKLKRYLPRTCNREVIDQWSDSRKGIKTWMAEARRKEPRLTPELLAEIRGGFPAKISIDYWDQPEEGDLDCDTWIYEAIVPADEKFYPGLVERIEKNNRVDEADVYALLNYPGKATEELLNEITNTRYPDWYSRRTLTVLQTWGDLDHPFNKQLVGRWELLGRNERVELNLREDHTCSIVTVPKSSADGFSKTVKGLGRWAVCDGNFSLFRTHAELQGAWRPAPRSFFRKTKRIEKANDDEVVLKGGPPMKRLPEDSR
jgi:hypothetical protein